jgi:hypothetical protein
MDVYFGPKAPVGKESNWVPTMSGGRFEVLFRFYGPEKPFFDRDFSSVLMARRLLPADQIAANRF